MGIPGEDLPGSWAATEFVAWYNGHPDYRDLEFDLSRERAVVVGNGNVAMDVARMLALTRDELAQTDVADHALEVLAEARVREIVVLGRRGPAQAAFTNPELLELGEMTDADVFVDPADVELDPLQPGLASRARPPHDRAARTSRSCTGYAGREPRGKRRRIVLRFLVSPVEILGDERVEGIRIVPQRAGRGRRRRAARPRDRHDRGARLRARVPLDRLSGHAADGLPFDERRRQIPNDGAGASTRARRCPASTPSAGSSAGPPASSAPTSATRRRPSTRCSRISTPGGCAPADPSRDSLEELLAERAARRT